MSQIEAIYYQNIYYRNSFKRLLKFYQIITLFNKEKMKKKNVRKHRHKHHTFRHSNTTTARTIQNELYQIPSGAHNYTSFSKLCLVHTNQFINIKRR